MYEILEMVIGWPSLRMAESDLFLACSKWFSVPKRSRLAVPLLVIGSNENGRSY
jgi:hypothetical protein